jgi:hypothetical protein
MLFREIIGGIVVIFGILVMAGIIRVTRRLIFGCPPGFAFMALGGAIAGWIETPF